MHVTIDHIKHLMLNLKIEFIFVISEFVYYLGNVLCRTVNIVFMVKN